MTGTVKYTPFSREELDLASKDQLTEWCREYGLDESGLKYELRLRLLEHIRKQDFLLKGEKPEGGAEEAGEVNWTGESDQEAAEAPEGEVEVVVEETAPACPTCGSALTYVPEYGRYYCYNCQRYPTEDEAGLVEGTSTFQPTKSAKIRQQARGNPKAGVGLALVGLFMFILQQILFKAPAIFDIPVFLVAPEIDFALQFLSIVFITLGVITAVLLVSPRR